MFDDAFLLRGNEVEQISDKPLPLGWKRTADAASYLSEARNVLNNPCGGARANEKTRTHLTGGLLGCNISHHLDTRLGRVGMGLSGPNFAVPD